MLLEGHELSAASEREAREPGRFPQIAVVPAGELEHKLLLAHDPSILKQVEWLRLSWEVVEAKRMLAALIHRLRNSAAKPEDEG